ncbi:MAG: alpha/beta hydrolase [Alphaproteobacteria bacterium]|nr:alpha/beta hydrolase [Alphaproteobacteria bacterium]
MTLTDAPLAAFKGERPPAPDWFVAALAQAPERSFFMCDGAAIELLTWGKVGKPGLLFLHGNGAHADWWSFIAPFFADTHRCAAMSWSGMGLSDRRSGGYEMAQHTAEAVAAIDAAGLDNGSGVMVVAHSAGGYPALLAGQISDRIKGIISLDSAIVPREMTADLPGPGVRPNRIYATQAEALVRYRIMPATIGDQFYAVDHIARTSLVPVEPDADGKGAPGGWQWSFDPEIYRHLHRDDFSGLPRAAQCPLALILGEDSDLIGDAVRTYMRGLYPDDAPFIPIPQAGHHIMVDQPLALVGILRTLLITWPARAAQTA